MRKLVFFLLILIPLISLAQGDAKKKAYYFFGEQCPHCKNVDEYFKANGIYEKYDITKLEFSNPFNARLLVKFGDAFDSQYKGSVPAIAFGDKFIVGDQPIIENFVKEIDAAANANELPDPEKIGKTENSGNQPAQSASGNKKNRNLLFFAIGLIGVIIGARLYLKKKSN